MSMSTVRLQNFRGFQDASIDLKPLTVLFGPNSAGKSSFGHALAAIAHAHRSFAGTPQATLTPRRDDAAAWPVDLGSTRDLRTQGAQGPVKIGLKSVEGWIELGFGSDSILELLPTYIKHPKGFQDDATSGTIPSTSSKLTLLPGSVPLAETGFGEEGRSEQNDQSHYYELERINERQWQQGGKPVIVILDGLVLKAATHESGTANLLSGKSQTDLRVFLENLSYLRATRKRPSRIYEAGIGKPQPIGYAGEWTATLLNRRGADPVTYANLPAVPQTFEGAKQLLGVSVAEDKSTLVEAVRTWLRRLGLARSLASERIKENLDLLEIIAMLDDQKAHNLAEIGFGVSQVLPILTAGLLQPKDSLFIVDLPEAHLHPRPQSDLADFFCSLALSDRNCLVETHSEMFFHRLRLRVAMQPELLDKIAVYFIDQPKDGLCCPPRKVGLAYSDEPTWPSGFFQEGWDTETQINFVRQARRGADTPNA
jgi:predicted ATPase